MNIKESKEQLEQQLQDLALEKQKTLDSLNLVAEPKRRKRVYELLQMQNQQQDDLNRELRAVLEKEQHAAVQQNSRNHQNQKVRGAVGIAFTIMVILLLAAVFQYQFSSFQSSSFLTGLSVGEIPAVQVKDKQDNEAGSSIVEVHEDGTYFLEVHIPDDISAGVQNEIFTSGKSIAQAREVSITMDGAEILQKMVRAKADYYLGTPPANSRLRTKVVSVEGVGNVNATIHLPKLGEVNTIFRCDDFDQEEFECSEWEATDIPFQDTGTEIVFTVDHFSAYVAGEIVAIDAIHLDSGYNFISNIFDDIKAVDDIWSESIAEGEFVRVTYEQNLTDGRVIDIFVRGETQDAYVEVYEAGTDNLVGSSTLILSSDWKYITVGGLSRPMDVFDLRITSTDPQARVEFDYIHDNVISPTQADGMVLWGGLNNASGQYRLWGSTNNFSEVGRTQGVGVNGTADILWTVLKSTWKRDEMILGTVGADADINIQIFNNSNQKWGPLVEVALSGASVQRRFDIAYEDLSGDALIVYENTTTLDIFIQYITWNGSRFSQFDNITLQDPSLSISRGQTFFAMLFPQSKTDNIMLMAHNNTAGGGAAGGALFAAPWTGSNFNMAHALVLTNQSASQNRQEFAFEWEGRSGDGVAFYGRETASNVADIALRTYNLTTGWGNEQNVAKITSGLRQLKICADVNSDYMTVIWSDASNKVNVTAWNGSQIMDSSPLQDGTAQAAGTGSVNIACEWFNETSALFTFQDTSPLGTLDYFTFSTPNTWNQSDLTATASTYSFGFGTAIGSLMSARHPTTNEIMFVAQTGPSSVKNVTMIRWDGTSFVSIAESPIATSLETLSAAQQGATFEWFRYDPFPNVTTLVPAVNSLATAGNAIEIGANITDNRLLYTDSNIPFYANVTYPNGSIQQLALSNSSQAPWKFNISFILPSGVAGVYNITFIVNDSRNSQNYTERTNFTVSAAGGVSCGTITSSTTMTQNLSTDGTCFTIGASNILLNCLGYEINYSSAGAAGSGVTNTGFSNVTVKNCIIKEGSGTGSGKNAINFNTAENGTIYNNTITITGSFSNAVNLYNANGTNVSENIIFIRSDASAIMLAPSSRHKVYFNTILISAVGGSTTTGISLAMPSFSNYFLANNITLEDVGKAISMASAGSAENIFENNTIYTRSGSIITDSNTMTTNTLLYNGTFGLINWTGTNLTTNLSLIVGTTIFVENNNLGVLDSSHMLELNRTAKLVFRGLAYSSTPQLLKAGVRCDGTEACNITYNSGTGELFANVSSFSNYTTQSSNTLPTAPLTFIPENGSSTTNRTPIFMWGNSTDVDGNVISYHLQVDDNKLFNNPEINVSAIEDLSRGSPEGNTTWYSTIELAVDTRYFWRVRANDSTGFGPWSDGDTGPTNGMNLSNFTVSSLLSITMMNNGVQFGSVAPGTQVNTSDGSPAPFRAENSGNIDTNVSLNASVLYATVPINRSAYQFKIRANESNAFSTALSAMDWTNMTNSTTAAHVVNLTWRDARNDFLTDINLTVPDDEPAGFKTSTITFVVVRNE